MTTIARPHLLPRAALLLALLGLIAGTASAHAVLRTANPAPDVTVDVGVSQIEVTFTEDVLREYTSVDVLDMQGKSQAAGEVEFDESAKTIIRRPLTPLTDGLYVVNWQTLSSDTHNVKGSYLFAVGNATLRTGGSSTVDEGSATASSGEVVPRALHFAGVFAALGASLFLLVVHRGPSPPRRASLLPAALALIGSVAGIATLLALASRTGLDPVTAASSMAGRTLIARASLLALAGTLLAFSTRASRGRRALLALALLPAAGSAIATTLSSHAASLATARTPAILADLTHLVVGGAWVGGVLTFLLLLTQRDERSEAIHLIQRFSPIALGSVVLLILTGTYASWRHLTTPTDLWTTTYGRAISLKLILLALLVALGYYNQARLGRAGAGSAELRVRLRRSLTAEATLMALVLAAAAVLSTTPPPAARQDPSAPFVPLIFEASNSTKLTHVILQIRPNPVTIGTQNLTILLHPLSARPIENNSFVTLKIAAPGEGEPEVTTDLTRVTPGEWTIQGGLFTSPGEWTVYVLVQRAGEFSKIPFKIPVTTPSVA